MRKKEIVLTAIERLKEIQGNHANCVVIAVYGNRAYDDGLIQLKDTAELCGFNVIASVAAVAEHSIMRQFGSGRPDEEDSKELKKFAEEILEKLSSEKEFLLIISCLAVMSINALAT